MSNTLIMCIVIVALLCFTICITVIKDIRNKRDIENIEERLKD